MASVLLNSVFMIALIITCVTTSWLTHPFVLIWQVITDIISAIDVLLSADGPALLEIDVSHGHLIEALVRERLPRRSVRIECDFARKARYAVIE